MKKLKLINVLGELEKEVDKLMVVFSEDFHTNVDVSDIPGDLGDVIRNGFNCPNRKAFCVKPGGLERDDPPRHSTVKLTVYGAIETTLQKMV